MCHGADVNAAVPDLLPLQVGPVRADPTPMRARPLVVLLAGAVAAAVVASAYPAAAGSGYVGVWTRELDGWNRSSSPVIADIDGDGHNEVVIGHQDGVLRAYEGDGAPKWSTPAIPGVGSGCHEQGRASAIDSSPAVADIDGDGTPEVVVGVGSTWVPNQNGSIVVFDGATGAREWGFTGGRDRGDVWDNSPVLDGWCEGVFSTPAIGDVDGDGHLDIAFASWDFQIWAVDRTGTPLAGFPFDQDDSVWSSPALFDLDGDNDMEIFIGGDSYPGGTFDHLGGVLRAFDWTPGGVVQMWNRTANEVFHSSPAIGDINADGRADVVVATGANWHIECGAGHPLCRPGDASDHVKVFAFHADDGSTVPGWPVSTGGPVTTSPALGDVDADGVPEVVVGSEDHKVYAWNGDGSVAWVVTPDFEPFGTGRMTGSPVIADLDGDGDQDVAIGSGVGLALLDGRNGSSLEEGLIWQNRMGSLRSYESAPAVGVLDGGRQIVFSGFDTPNFTTRIAAYHLPDTTATDDWPMFRHSATRRGDFGASPCGFRSSRTFCDVVAGRYFSDAVTWMVAEGITVGVSDLHYGPDLVLTRGQMVTFLWRQEGSPTGYPAHGFGDVPAGAFYESAVRWARATGITTGTSSTTFSPDATVTRSQLVTLLWRRAGAPPADPPVDFVDVPLGRFYTTAVGWARDNDITTGTSATTFSPDTDVTRAQAAAFLWREAGSPSVS